MKQTNSISFKTVLQITHDLHKDNKTIGFTHGTFDLFHTGHLYLLDNAAKQCDYLIVGVDSDKNAKTYKDNRRPIINEKERKQVISSLNVVDAVFINNIDISKDAYEDLYKELHINRLFIGNKFSFESEIYESSIKLNINLIPVLNRVNQTTRIINEILKRYAEPNKKNN